MSLLLLSFSLFVYGSLSDCTWTITNSTTGKKSKLDLSKLSGNIYSVIGSDNSNNEYNVSICSNDLICPGQTGQSWMVTQQYVPDPSLCYYIGSYDSSINPTMGYTSGALSWTFTYPNGEASGGCSVTGRTAILRFICSNTLSKDEVITDAYEDEQCTYEIDLYTPYACGGSSGGGGGGSNNDDLSGGSIFLIILLCVFVSYCIIGYIWNKVRNPENGWGDVKSNTPNYQFWCLLPKYVITGCIVTKEKITGNSDSGHEQIPDTAGDE